MLMECQSRTIANRGGMVYRSFSNYLCIQNWGKLLLWWKMLLVFKIFLHNMAASQKYNCCMALGNCPFMNHEFMFNFQANNPQSTSGSILNRHSDWYLVDTLQQSIDNWQSVNQLICCLPRCWWSVNQVSTEVLMECWSISIEGWLRVSIESIDRQSAIQCRCLKCTWPNWVLTYYFLTYLTHDEMSRHLVQIHYPPLPHSMDYPFHFIPQSIRARTCTSAS